MNPQLLDQILNSPRLPSLPAIALEVIELVQQSDVNIRQIADTIQHDPALSSKILKVVNSSFYGQSSSVSSISNALVVLGLNSVKTLALGFSLVDNLGEAGGSGFDHLQFWKRSIYTATAAKSLANQVGLVTQEEAFLGGLLQDLGMLVMNQTLKNEYGELMATSGRDHKKLRELELAKFEIDHAGVGATLAEAWKLPPLLVEPIRFHETPDDAEGDLESPVRCVALGNLVAEVFVGESPGAVLETYLEQAEAWFGLSKEVAEPLLRSIATDTNEMRRLFNLPTGDLGNPDGILARANEALTTVALQSQQQQNELQQQNQELSAKAHTDGLTKVANRRRFDEFAAEQFATAGSSGGKSGGPLSVLFLDADKFKSLNDTHGHQTGDRVLVELASLLQSLTPAGSLVARYGGEEFALVLPNTDRRQAARLAEQTRQKIEQTPIGSDTGERLPVTASIGVATHDGDLFQRVEQLIKAADQGVYAAKSGGRNCVRIFTPRRPEAA